jgi:hypothetical protein
VPEDERTEDDQPEDELVEDQRPLRADNFIAFLASLSRTIRERFGPIVLAFIGMNLVITAAVLGTARTVEVGVTAVGILFLVGQFLLTTIVGGYVAIAASYVRVESMQGRRAGILDGFRFARPSWAQIISACLFTGLVATLVPFGAGLLGLLLVVPLRLGPPILLLVIGFERMSLSTGWVRATDILKKNILRTYIYLLMWSLMALLILLTVLRFTEIGILELPMSELGQSLLATGATVVMYALLDVAMSAGLLVTYVDNRARTEEDFSLGDLVAEEAA